MVSDAIINLIMSSGLEEVMNDDYKCIEFVKTANRKPCLYILMTVISLLKILNYA